jgi:hypothetical protein
MPSADGGPRAPVRRSPAWRHGCVGDRHLRATRDHHRRDSESAGLRHRPAASHSRVHHRPGTRLAFRPVTSPCGASLPGLADLPRCGPTRTAPGQSMTNDQVQRGDSEAESHRTCSANAVTAAAALVGITARLPSSCVQLSISPSSGCSPETYSLARGNSTPRTARQPAGLSRGTPFAIRWSCPVSSSRARFVARPGIPKALLSTARTSAAYQRSGAAGSNYCRVTIRIYQILSVESLRRILRNRYICPS